MIATPGQIASALDHFAALRVRGLSSRAVVAARSIAAKRGLVINIRAGSLVAASALTAAAWHEIEHRRVTAAELDPPLSSPEPGRRVRVGSLHDLRFRRESLALIERELVREWGDYAFLGFQTFEEMVAKAGRTVLVASQLEDGIYKPKAVLQATLTGVGGDPDRLRSEYASFAGLVGPQTWKRARSHGGDTAVLLQITVLDKDERGGGLGSLLRNTALHMLGEHVKFALTTTPVDTGPGPLDLSDPATFTPAMKFHARGGAQPTLVLPAFKTRRETDAGTPHGSDIVVMRYARDENGNWPAPRPDMRLHSIGPIEDALLWTARTLRTLAADGTVRVWEATLPALKRFPRRINVPAAT